MPKQPIKQVPEEFQYHWALKYIIHRGYIPHLKYLPQTILESKHAVISEIWGFHRHVGDVESLSGYHVQVILTNSFTGVLELLATFILRVVQEI
jgi:hypothetical protein